MEENAKEPRDRVKNAIYWKGSGEALPVLTAALKNLDFTVEYIDELDSIRNISSPHEVSLLVVDLLGDESAISSKLIELASASELLRHAGVTLVGRLPDDRFLSLSKKYPRLELLQPPFSQERINKISWFYESQAKGSLKNDSDSPNSLAAVMRLESAYGGKSFGLGNTRSSFRIPAISSFPKLKAVSDRIWQSSPMSALRGQRIAESATSLAKEIGLSEKKQTDLAQAAFFLHGISAESNNSKYELYNDFFSRGERNQLSELSEAYKSTSVIVADDLGLPDAARYIRELSEHLQSASQSQEPTKVSNSVGCLLIPELAERAVWQQGRWDRYALSRMMRKLVSGSLFSFSVNLVTAFGKMIAEAVGLRLLVNPEPVKLYETQLPFSRELIEEEEAKSKNKLNGRKIKQVELADLRSGMTVLAPIVTADGVLLIRSDVVLDNDVIECLRNLASVRPLQGHICVEQI